MRRLRGPYAVRYDWTTRGSIQHPPHTFLDGVPSEPQAIRAGSDAFRLDVSRDLSLVGVAWCRVTDGALEWQRLQEPDSDGRRLTGLSSDNTDFRVEDQT